MPPLRLRPHDTRPTDAPADPLRLTRRGALDFGAAALAFGAAALAAGAGVPGEAAAQQSEFTFPQWRERFRARARERGIRDDVYDRVMGAIEPDTSVYALDRAQPEFREPVWQYLNRRVSEWRIVTGRARVREFDPLLDRIENEIGVDRWTMLGLWGNESAFGEVVARPGIMKPVFPSLAALAWGEPRRRRYWETELLNALVIVQRGWGNPEEMRGSWAGAMGHTQWMPEVWLNIGLDFDGDGRANPFSAADALAGTARYLMQRGRYRKGEVWGAEARVPASLDGDFRDVRQAPQRTVAEWRAAGVTPAVGRDFPDIGDKPRLWQPVAGGPAFLVGQNFLAVRSYNPASTYALAVVHLGDRVRGADAFAQQFPGGERIMTTAELAEIQQRLTAMGLDTGGTEGRVGPMTMRAVREYQGRVNIDPADGYPGLKVLEALRAGRR
jgi:lytic murein transglycosylase